MSKIRLPGIAVMLIWSLAACGQRGPLYLPEETAAPAAPAQASQSKDALEAELQTEDVLQDDEG